MPNVAKRVAPRSRDEWRAWLAENHESTTEVWLVFYKQGTGVATLSYNDAVEEALCFGWVDGLKKTLDDRRYMHRLSPRKPRSKWSASNIARVSRLIASGLMTPAGQRLIDEAKESGTWKAEERPRAAPMHPEFSAALRKNKRAATFYASLAPGYQRQYRDWVATAKRDETRTRRIAQAVEHLAAGKKPGL